MSALAELSEYIERVVRETSPSVVAVATAVRPAQPAPQPQYNTPGSPLGHR